ncbi:uncharacterized protein JCM6883_002288 [Sporobolomyces salmoneus]|uniref:uncharacterized protein n=1 Tax=Sporobolomyces salmoneus TaxID=183962 RepID=UPI003174A43E
MTSEEKPTDPTADTTTPAADTVAEGSTPAAWTKQYDTISSKLPDAVSKRLPTSSQAQSSLDTLTKNVTQTYGTAVNSTKQFGQTQKANYARLSAQTFTKNAWSITNETQIPINVALGQVGPLMYEVILPGETFARRVPNVWYWAEIRPRTSPASEYNAWDRTWPILCVTGPTVALASLLAIPFVAVAVGGSALASLSSFGSAIIGGTTAAVSGTAEAITGSIGATASFAAKANRIPGSGKVRGKLVDAAKKAVGAKASDRNLQESIVRYVTSSAEGAGKGGVAKGKEKLAELKNREEETSEEQFEVEKETKRRKKELDEIDVTGHELEKVLRCETGDAKLDKALEKAFKKLGFKSTTFKTKNNPVLRIIGGPELETRESDKREILVFYPFALLPVPNLTVEPISLSEAPATTEEKEMIRDGRVVESFEEAERAARELKEQTKLTRSDSRDETEITFKQEEKRRAELDKVVEKAIEEGDSGETTEAEKEKEASTPGAEKKKWWGWF